MLGGRQEFRKNSRVEAPGPPDVEHRRLVEPDDLTRRPDAQLTAMLADQQKDRLLFFRPGRVLPVGTAFSSAYAFVLGAGASFVAAPFAVVGPSAEVPAAESPNPFFAAVSSTCRRVNSWKNRSPTG